MSIESHIHTFLHALEQPSIIPQMMNKAKALLGRSLEPQEYKAYWERCMLAYYYGGLEIAYAHVNQDMGIVASGPSHEVAEVLDRLSPDEVAQVTIRTHVDTFEMILRELAYDKVVIPSVIIVEELTKNRETRRPYYLSSFSMN